MNKHRLNAYLMLVMVSLIWGAASVVIKFTLDGIDPVPFLVYRFFLSSLVALVTLSSIRKVFKGGKSLKLIFAIIAYGFLSTTFALGFLFLGLDKTTVLNMSLIALIAPLLTEIAGVIFLKEHITKKEKIGSAIAFSGTLLTIIEPVLKSGANLGSFEGNILILLYLAGDVSSVILLKKILRDRVSPIALTNISFVVGFVTIYMVYAVLYPPLEIFETIKALPVKYHIGVWYMAFMSGTVAYFLRAKAQKTIEIGEASLFAYLTAIFTAPLAVIFLKETITPIFIVGAVIIAIGVSIAEYKKRKKAIS